MGGSPRISDTISRAITPETFSVLRRNGMLVACARTLEPCHRRPSVSSDYDRLIVGMTTSEARRSRGYLRPRGRTSSDNHNSSNHRVCSHVMHNLTASGDAVHVGHERRP